jgi:hypothetical protein
MSAQHVDEDIQEQWLLDFSMRVAEACESGFVSGGVKLKKPASLRAYRVSTDGWAVQIGKSKSDKGSGLQLWLDRYTGEAGRKLYYGYYSPNLSEIRRIAVEAQDIFGKAVYLGDGHWEEVGRYARLKRPVPLDKPDRPFAELYKDGEKCHGFYGFYLPRTPNFTRPPSSATIKAAVDFFEVLAGLADGGTEEYSAHENRVHVRLHRLRERSPRLAALAKAEADYTCTVCGIHFERLYGDLGKGFAEAHHKVPLSSLKPGVRTNVSDLVVVCANCHRMLHRMDGKAGDVEKLKAAFTGKWPG